MKLVTPLTTAVVLCALSVLPFARAQEQSNKPPDGSLPIVQKSTNSDPRAASQHIQDLHKGILLVRLETNRKKLAAIDSLIEVSSTARDSAKWAKINEETLMETVQRQYEIIDAIHEGYKFSDVAYFMDQDSRAVLSGKKNPTKSDLKTEVEIEPGTPIYVIADTRTPEQKIQGFVIYTADLGLPPRPFPGIVSRSGLAGLFGNDYTYIERLNKKLYKYYDKVRAGRN